MFKNILWTRKQKMSKETAKKIENFANKRNFHLKIMTGSGGGLWSVSLFLLLLGCGGLYIVIS